MINKAEFEDIKKDLLSFEEKREEVIALSRTIIQLSKKIIYAVHRTDMDKAKSLIPEITKKVKLLPEKNYDTGMANVAKQEYVEALTFFEFVKSGKIPGRKTLDVSSDQYLLGMCDLTGEIVRFGVNQAVKNNKKETEKAKNSVEEIYGQFLELDLRNGELRKKSDQIKYNLLRLEEVVYNLKK
tara:strand:- start:258 stop:809 length:552 start_codon:yes stop_codon:yes gene_type:complete